MEALVYTLIMLLFISIGAYLMYVFMNERLLREKDRVNEFHRRAQNAEGKFESKVQKAQNEATFWRNRYTEGLHLQTIACNDLARCYRAAAMVTGRSHDIVLIPSEKENLYMDDDGNTHIRVKVFRGAETHYYPVLDTVCDAFSSLTYHDEGRY